MECSHKKTETEQENWREFVEKENSFLQNKVDMLQIRIDNDSSYYKKEIELRDQ